MAVVIIRQDLLGQAAPQTPLLLNYTQLDKDDSLTNTTNTFAVYVVKCMLEWLKEQLRIDEVMTRILENLRQVVTHDAALGARARTHVRLADGRIVERGTHAELVARGGAYAGMWALQQSASAE